MPASAKQSFFAKLTPGNALLPIMFMLLSVWQLINDVAFQDPDTGWHIKSGEWILAHKQLPLVDPWSFTAGDTEWFNLSWLYDIILALLHSVGGLPFLYAITIIGYSLIGVLTLRKALKRGAGFLCSIIVFSICVCPMVAQVSLCRPQMVAAFFLIACLSIFERDRQSESWPRLFLLPLIMLLWVNMHGSFLIMPFLFFCFMFEAYIQRDDARVKRLFIIGVVTALAILCNPYGYHIVEGALRTLHSVMKSSLIEWQSVKFNADYHYGFFLLLFILGFRPMDKTTRLADKLLALLLLFMTLISIRHGFMLAIAAAPLLAANLTKTLYEFSFGKKCEAKDADFASDMVKPIVCKSALAACFILVAALILPTTRNIIAPNSDQLLSGKTPEKALAYIAMHHPGLKWWNDYGLGGALIYYADPSFKVLIDGRADTAYPRAFLKDYLKFSEAWGLGRTSQEIIKKYQIDGIIMQTDSKYTKYLLKNLRWKRVYRDKAVTLFVKQLKTD